MKILIAFLIISMVCVHLHAERTDDHNTSRDATRKNVVIIFLDDSGYADFHPFGNPPYETPNVQRLAEEGRRFTRFHVPQAICSASRAALLTGCYPGRTKVFGAFPPEERGLETKFATLGEVYKADGYITGWFGKWHLGDQADTRPQARGFEETAGLMYSNDMWEHHPSDPDYWGRIPLAWWENGKVTIDQVTWDHQKMLTTWVTENSVDFIERNKKKPFLLYMAHPMPHVPIHCSDKFIGKSGCGLYGDVIMELDWSVGEILNSLRENGLEENTIVLFSSDNGPWVSYGNHAGKTPFRESKATSFCGGTQSAFILKVPGELESGTISEDTFCSIDILPTLCALTGTPLPGNPVDGKNVWDLISGAEGAENPHQYYPISTQTNFEGLISSDGRWKLHLPHTYQHLTTPGHDGLPGEYETRRIDLSLFDLHADPEESTNAIDQYPEVAEQLLKLAEQHKQRFYK